MANRAVPYRIAPLAEADLEEIWLYTFRNWSIEQADQYHNDIISVIEDLASGARSGRLSEVRPGYFKCASGSHFIYYRLDGTELIVVRVLHQRMDVRRHLK